MTRKKPECIFIPQLNYSLEHTIQRELHKFDSFEKKGRNFCLLLFVYLDEAGEAEKKQLLEIEKQFITFEAINPYAAATVLVIAIDSSMHTGYLLDIGNGKSITLYAHACKLLKKIFYNDPIEQGRNLVPNNGYLGNDTGLNKY